MDGKGYHPPRFLKNAHVQSVLASSRWRTRGTAHFRHRSKERIVTTSQGTRLLGAYTPPERHHRHPGLVLMLPGWEGGIDSAYMLSLGNYLSQRGLAVFRLNMRDHGDSHHLNPGLFHGALIEETEEAVALIAREYEGDPFFLVGFSLGGNFALRIALRQQVTSFPIPNLRHVFAISPPFNPYKTTLILDQVPSSTARTFSKSGSVHLRKNSPSSHTFTILPLFLLSARALS